MSNAWHRPLKLEREPRRALSFTEWLALDEDEPGELVDGFLEDEELPDAIHELTLTWLVAALAAWLGLRGFVLGSEAKYKLLPTRGRKPDVSVYLPGTKPPTARGALVTPPDIFIEIVTPTPRDERRDRVEKRLEYAQFGVRWYWLVDPALRTFEILERDRSGQYVFRLTATEGVLKRIPGCAGLRLDIDALWANIARLEEPPARTPKKRGSAKSKRG